MYPLFESIRVEDGVALNIDYHQKRMARSSDLLLGPYLDKICLPLGGVHKLRITYTQDQFLGFTLAPYFYRTINTLAPVHDNLINYGEKSEDRRVIEHLWAQRGQCDDILIIKNGLVTDTSFCNILLLDGNGLSNSGDSWVTPSAPLLEGTCRARLLDQGLITATEIPLADLKKYTKFMLINAFMDFDPRRTQPLSL